MNDGILDQLREIMETRVNQLRTEAEEQKGQPYQKETREHMEHMKRIFQMLPDSEREWLDNQLMDRLEIPETERLKYYKAGLADAICLLQFLRS